MVKEYTDDDYTKEDWELFFVLEKIAERGREKAALRIKGDAPGRFFESFKRAENGNIRDLVVFHQQGHESTDNFSRSCSMSIDDIGEVIGLFEKFFKL